MNRQLSKDKKLNLLPKKSSSRSLKQEKSSKIISKLPSYNQQYLNESQTEMMNIKTRTNSNIFEKNQILSAQQLPIKQKVNSDYHIQEK